MVELECSRLFATFKLCIDLLKSKEYGSQKWDLLLDSLPSDLDPESRYNDFIS